MAYLKRFPIDKLKIDQSFVRGIPADAADLEIAAAVIALAKNLKLEVLAEGVETEDNSHSSSATVAAPARGYRFSRPLPEKALVRWLALQAGICGKPKWK